MGPRGAIQSSSAPAAIQAPIFAWSDAESGVPPSGIRVLGPQVVVVPVIFCTR